MVIRPHWYWTHDLSLIRAALGPTELTRNRFKTVSDRGLWGRVKGLFTLPHIVSGFLLQHVKGTGSDKNGHVDGSLLLPRIHGLQSNAVPGSPRLSLTGSSCNSRVNKGRDKCFNRTFLFFFFLFHFLMGNSNKNTRSIAHYFRSDFLWVTCFDLKLPIANHYFHFLFFKEI